MKATKLRTPKLVYKYIFLEQIGQVMYSVKKMWGKALYAKTWSLKRQTPPAALPET